MKANLNEKILVVMVLMVFVISGCGPNTMMTRPDMHAVPDLNQAPEKFTLISVKQNPRLLIAEGIQDSATWPAYVYDKAGKAHALRAVNPGQKSNRLRLDIICLLGKEDTQYVVVFDRLGKTAYNSAGQGMAIKDLKEFKPANYQDFFQIDPTNVKEISKGSEDYLELVSEYKLAFQQDVGSKLANVKLKYKSELEKYSYNVPEWRMKQIVREDSNAQAVLDFLKKGWYVYATWPFIGAENTAIVAGLVKVFQIPTLFNDKIDLPGYGTYMPPAKDVAEMVEIGFQIYGTGGGRQAIRSGKIPLTFEHKALIQGTPCAGSEYYEDYNNACVLKYNAQIVESNTKIGAGK